MITPVVLRSFGEARFEEHVSEVLRKVGENEIRSPRIWNESTRAAKRIQTQYQLIKPL